MNGLLSQSCHPDCVRAINERKDYTASQSAALVAANLISTARLSLNLDTEFTDYSAQYLVDNAGKGEMDQQHRELTVKDCLQYAFKRGMPIMEQWSHLGCTLPVPLLACNIPRVPMKGEVIEATDLDEALKLIMEKGQPMGARLHVFNPQFDSVGEGIYVGPDGNGTRYVGLRDVIIVGAKRIDDEIVVTVHIFYKMEILSVKVSGTRMFLSCNENQVTMPPTGLLVDFCGPRLSIN